MSAIRTRYFRSVTTDPPCDEFFEVLWRRYRRGQVDTAEGAVPIPDLAEAFGISRSATRTRLDHLVEQGAIEEVIGQNPETGLPRSSYRPTAFTDDPWPGWRSL